MTDLNVRIEAGSHGTETGSLVVAREYGIPAVVGVPNATESIETGQFLTVDGSSGTIAVADTRGRDHP